MNCRFIVLISLVLIMGCGITPLQTPHISRREAIIGTFYDPIDSSFCWVSKGAVGGIREIDTCDTSYKIGASIGLCMSYPDIYGVGLGMYEEIKIGLLTNPLDIGLGANLYFWAPLGVFGGIGMKSTFGYMYLMYNHIFSYDFVIDEDATIVHKLTLGLQKRIFQLPIFIEIFGCAYNGSHYSGEGLGSAVGIGYDKYY